MNNNKLHLPISFSLYNSASTLRLDLALGLALPELGMRARRRLWENCQILVNNKPRAAGFAVKNKDKICIMAQDFHVSPEQKLSFEPFCVFAKAGLFAIAKPAGLHSAKIMGGNKANIEERLPEILAGHLAGEDIENVKLFTRLDGQTSGLLLAGNCSQEKKFRNMEIYGQVQKTYLALVCGQMQEPITCTKTLDTDNRATTKVEPFASTDSTRHTKAEALKIWDLDCGSISLVKVEIQRGARHQIRAHLADAGFALVGDKLYGAELELSTVLTELGITKLGTVVAAEPNLSEPAEQLPDFLLHHSKIDMPDFSVNLLPKWWGLEKEIGEI